MHGISMVELWGTMGIFAKGIVFTLLAMSLYTATIAIRKWIQLGKTRKATLKFAGPFSQALANEDFAEAERLVEGNPNSHLATAFRRVFPSITFHSQDHALSAVEVASVQRMIDLNNLEQLSRFRRGLGVLATTGATAPFVGLLGTTMGVVTAFTGMAAAGSGGLAAISAGIAEALIVTALGLIVAIPAVWLYNYFINRIDYLSMEVTYTTKEFMDFLIRYEAGLEARLGKSGDAAMLESGASAHAGSDAKAGDRARMS